MNYKKNGCYEYNHNYVLSRVGIIIGVFNCEILSDTLGFLEITSQNCCYKLGYVMLLFNDCMNPLWLPRFCFDLISSFVFDFNEISFNITIKFVYIIKFWFVKQTWPRLRISRWLSFYLLFKHFSCSSFLIWFVIYYSDLLLIELIELIESVD